MTGRALFLEKPVYGGDCLGHLAANGDKPGKAVFVPLSLPGERVFASLVEEKRTFAKAEIDQVVQASPNRVAPHCRHFGRCGGCQYQHANYDTQLEIKEQILREILARAGVEAPAEISTLSAEPWNYRNRIRLAVFTDPSGKIQMGYRSRGSHDLIAIVECPISASLLIDTAKNICSFLQKQASPIAINEMELFTNQDNSELLVTLFCASDDSDPSRADRWLERLSTAIPSITGLRIQLADGSLNSPVLAGRGIEELTYAAAGFLYSVEHGAFFQVNRQLLDLFADLVTATRAGHEAWDLFAGVGLFGRCLSNSFTHVKCVESAPASQKALKSNLAGTTGVALATTTVEFLRDNRQQREPRPDLIVLDPPRAGLGGEVCTLLNAIGAPKIVYVSCDPITLARDLRALTTERYRIERLTQVDMFPQTFHLETVVELTRS